jgi:phage terminase large subunit-like protein
MAENWKEWDDAAKSRLLWTLQARPEQLTPAGSWNIWLLLAGRGFGKTRTGAEDAAWYGQRFPGVRIAVVAPTISDARDTCIEGESGLLACLPHGSYKWNRSMGELTLDNGSMYKTFSAEEPERLRGPQHHRAWCDELAAWKKLGDTWDQLMFGLRLKGPDGSDPQCIATTTPRPLPFLRDLVKREDVHITKGSTFDNAANLSPAALAQLRASYEGTRMGQQELQGVLLDDVEGALFTTAMIDDNRLRLPPHMSELTPDDVFRELDLAKVVIAIDPAVTANKHSDMTGIIVVGKGHDGFGYVIADRSTKASPGAWALRAIKAYDEYKADHIVAEVNNGGDLVRHTIQTEDPFVVVRAVTASRGKIVRAEPVAAMYEQGKIRHVGTLPELEEQMVMWDPDSGESPDRMDALVWGITDLFLTSKQGRSGPPLMDTRLRGRR